MNSVVLLGRLTKDADIRQTANTDLTVARFTLAVDRRIKKDSEQSADFISCVAFGKTADFIAKYIRKGTKICLNGRIQTGSYNRQDGTKVYTTDVVVENVEFAESKAAQAQHQGQPQEPAEEMPEGFMAIPDGLEDEGLPFC